MLDWIRLWPEFFRLNLQKARHHRRLRRVRQKLGTYPLASGGPAPCQSSSDSGRAGVTRCEACHRLDHARLYRLVCPDLRIQGTDTVCTADATSIAPRWGRALAAAVLPPGLLALLLALGAWGLLRNQGLDTLSPLDLLLPSRWSHVTETRRAHFQHVALRALAAGDPATAATALFTAAQTGHGTSAQNRELARLATLGGFHALADQLHAANLARHPEESDTINIAWHDDLLIGDRPARLAELALERLADAAASRGFWLHAFFTGIRSPGVSAPLLDPGTTPPPHPGLGHALAARAALDQGQIPRAREALHALGALPPGPEARAFLVDSWLEAGDADQALAAALDPSHPATPGELIRLAYHVHKHTGAHTTARHALRPLLPRQEEHCSLLHTLVRAPDPDLIEELFTLAPPSRRTPTHELVALWLAARRADRADLAVKPADELALRGAAIPEALLGADLTAPDHQIINLCAAVLPLDREMLRTLRNLSYGP